MGLKIVYSAFALDDLKNIYDYIARDSKYYAKREVSFIRTTVKKLKITPYSGKQFEKAANEFTREFVFRNYRIIYDISEKEINILSIHHHARLIKNNLAFGENTD